MAVAPRIPLLTEPNTTQWLAPLLVLVFGMTLGAVLLLVTRRKRASKDGGPANLDEEDLQARLSGLLHQLRELGSPSADESSDLRDERTRLEEAAARVLRDLDRVVQPASCTAPASQSVAVVDSAAVAARRMIWITTAGVTAAVLYVLLMQSAAPRDPDGTATGNLPPSATSPAAGGAAGDDAEVKRLSALVAASPANLELRNDLARRFLETRQLMNVFTETQFVLERQPNNVRALAYQSLVKLSMGQGEEALAMLQRALQADPNSLDAWLHMSIVQLELGNPKAAMNALDVAAQRHPKQAAFLAQVRSALTERLSADAGKTAAVASSKGSEFAGTLELTGDYQGKAGALVFVTVRPAGSTSGPPLAAKRLTATSFPLRFSITGADSMQGGALPQSARVEARIDSDGNPLTRDPADPSGFVDGVKLGTADLKIVLMNAERRK